MQKIVERINALEASLDGDVDLLEWTQTLRERASNGETLDALVARSLCRCA